VKTKTPLMLNVYFVVVYNSHIVLEINPLKIALNERIIGHVLA